MASFVMLNANVRVTNQSNTVKDLTPYILSATLNYEVELVEDSAMGGGNTRSRLIGLRDWSLEMTMKQDFNPSYSSPQDQGPDDVLWPLIYNGSVRLIQVAANGSSISANNPRFYGNAVLSSYSPLAGTVGELSTTPANFMSAGALSRATSAWTT